MPARDGEGARVAAIVVAAVALGTVGGALFLVFSDGAAPTSPGPTPAPSAAELEPPSAPTRPSGPPSKDAAPLGTTSTLERAPDGGIAATSAPDAGLADAGPSDGGVDAGLADGGTDGRAILSGEVRDTQQRAVPMATVRVTLKDARSFVDVATVTTGPEGRFRAEGLPAGTVVLEARAPGYRTQIADDVSLVAGEEKRVELTLTPGQRLAGRVVDDAGEPVRGAEVTAVPPADDDSGDQVRTSDGEGRFSFEELGRGPYCLYARKAPLVDGKLCGARPGGGEVVLRMGRAGAIAGRVQHTLGARPVERFHVAARREDPDDDSESGITNHDFATATGEFRVADLAPGRYRVNVRAEGRLFAERGGIEVRAGETTGGLVFELAGGARISGVVLSTAGGPVADAKVELLLGGSGRGIPTRTDEGGRFEFDGVSASSHRVNVEKVGFQPLVLHPIPSGALTGEPVTLTLRPR